MNEVLLLLIGVSLVGGLLGLIIGELTHRRFEKGEAQLKSQLRDLDAELAAIRKRHKEKAEELDKIVVPAKLKVRKKKTTKKTK